MSSSIPTSLTNPALATPRTEEPADQWASSTLSALDPNTTTDSYVSGPHVSKEGQNFTTGTASTATTPGVNMPGGFPGSKSGPGIVQPDVEQIKGVALNAYERVQGYAVSAAATASTAAQSAGETVGQYLPESMKGYLPGTATADLNPNHTLPSEELSQNAHPSTHGGVGSLPGPPGEADVAVLPHERTGGVSTDKLVNESLAGASLNKSSPISTTTNNNAAVTSSGTDNNPESTHSGFIPTSLAAESTTSIVKLPEETQHHNLPTHDDESSTALGKSAGVGKLPGSVDESSVALLPDERKSTGGDKSKLSPPSMGSGADTDASVKTLAGSHVDAHPHAPPSMTTGLDFETNTSGRAPGAVGAGSGAAIKGPQTQARQHPLAQDEKSAFEKDNKNFMTKDQVATNVSSIGAPAATGAPASGTHSTAPGGAKPKHEDAPAATGAPAPGMHTTASSVATPGHGDTPFTMKSSQDKEINQSAHSASPSSDSGSGNGPAKKTGFMSKVKGEMKVLSGKMSKDESKIEEGKKLMGKN